MTKIKSSSSPKSNNTSSKDPISILKTIKNKINEIKSNNDKKYSLISLIFLCYIEKGKTILNRKELFEYIKNEVEKNQNRIVSTYKFNKAEKGLVTENNYYNKLSQSLLKNKVFTKISNDNKDLVQYELNLEFLMRRKSFLYKQMFGEKLPETETVKKRKKRKFNNILSVIKLQTPKIFKNGKKNENSINIEIKDNPNLEIESSTLSLKESEIKMKKSEENSIDNSRFIDIKLEPKKLDYFELNSLFPKSGVNSKKKNNSNVSSNENSLIMPLFNDFIFNEKNVKYKMINIDNDKGQSSNSLKEINIIINKGEEFLTLLKNPQLVNLLNNNNNYKKLGSSILELKDNNYPKQLLMSASDNYTDLCKYLDYFLYERKNNCDSIVDNFDVKLIKIKCSLIISAIITKLSQFLLEYNYFVEIIANIFEYEHNFILNEMIKIINYDKNIMSKDNIDNLENLLRIELENASNSRD